MRKCNHKFEKLDSMKCVIILLKMNLKVRIITLSPLFRHNIFYWARQKKLLSTMLFIVTFGENVSPPFIYGN